MHLGWWWGVWADGGSFPWIVTARTLQFVKFLWNKPNQNRLCHIPIVHWWAPLALNIQWFNCSLSLSDPSLLSLLRVLVAQLLLANGIFILAPLLHFHSQSLSAQLLSVYQIFYPTLSWESLQQASGLLSCNRWSKSLQKCARRFRRKAESQLLGKLGLKDKIEEQHPKPPFTSLWGALAYCRCFLLMLLFGAKEDLSAV